MDDKIFDKFSESARLILLASQQLAETTQSPIGSEHVLLALALNRGTFANEILREYDINLDQIKLVMGLGNINSGGSSGSLNEDGQALLLGAIKIAADYGHLSVDAEHILLAMVTKTRLAAYTVIEKLGVNPEHIKRQIESLFEEIAEIDQMVKRDDRGPRKSRARTKGGKTPALDYFTVDLTKKADRGELDPLIGREKELTRLLQILSRRQKNNPVLIGEPGVGKTAIVEGLAYRLINGQVPAKLLGRRLLALDLGLMVAGTMYRGQFEDRFKKVIEELKVSGDAIVFIDELHTVIGAGSAEGSMDAANILKPALTQGWIRLIGATTNEEYRKHIRKDAAFERRLQVINVGEPTKSETVAILNGLRGHYEEHHQVIISDEAIEAAVELSSRYITEQFLPDKAIDLIDEAAAATQLTRERATKTTGIMKKIARLMREKDRAVSEEAYQLASQLKDQIDQLQSTLATMQAKYGPNSKPIIDRLAIGQLVAERTGVPLDNLVKAERLRYYNLAQTLSQAVIGQEEAVTKIANAIKRSRTGLSHPDRPIGSFIFLGPTGVGKTELAKIIAREVFGSAKALIKIDMSDFMERHNAARLVGAPAGYIGYEDGGKLTEAVRRQPYSVVLFDEIEKAHPDIFNLFLQILDEGQLVDAKGTAVNFRNTIIILTSNLGMAELNRQAAIGFAADNLSEQELAAKQYQKVVASINKTLKEQFRPEFLNRLDQTIIFQPLTKSTMKLIAERQLGELRTRAGALGYQIELTDAALERLIDLGFDPANGARALRRAVSEYLELTLADYLLLRNPKAGTTLLIDCRRQQFSVRAKRRSRSREVATENVQLPIS